MTPLWQLDAVSLLELYRLGTASPDQVVADITARINALQASTNAYCSLNTLVAVEAEASAVRWAKGAPCGPLDGVPIIIKDNLAVEGMPASWGNAELSTRMVKQDELPVARLRAAGALILGKGNTPEFAVEGYTGNAVFGVTTNPFNTSLTPGGSSGGVVSAIASGQATVGVGTDGGGSIRRPAGYCGLIGLKPGLGHVPRAQGLPQVLLDFEVVGPLTRSVRDARLLDSVLSGMSRHDQVSRCHVSAAKPPAVTRVLYVPRLLGSPCDPQIIASTNELVNRLSKLDCAISEDELPLPISALCSQWSAIGEIGLARFFDNDHQVAQSASPRYRQMAERGRLASATVLSHLLEQISLLRVAASELFAHWDIIVTPASAAMPWAASEAYPSIIDGQQVGPRGHAVYTGWVNAMGHPAITLPATPAPDGMPIGVQLIGDLGSEKLLLDMAERYTATHGNFEFPSQLAMN